MYGFDPQQNPGVDPQDLLNRQNSASQNSQDPTQELESGAQSFRSALGNAAQNQQDQFKNLKVDMIRQQQQADAQQPGGIRRAFAGMFSGMAAAAMKQATGQTPEEMQYQRAQTQAVLQDAEMKRQQMQRMMMPVEIPDFRDPTGKGTITLPAFLAEKAFPQVVSGTFRERIGDKANDTKENIAGDKNQTTKDVANIAGQYKVQAAQAKPSETQLIIRAQGGDAEAQKTLDTMQQRKIQAGTATAMARGKAFGMYRTNTYFDPELGQVVPMFAGDAMNEIANGRRLIPAGTLPSSVYVGAQRLKSEAVPAIAGVRNELGAFDNSSDRAVFARIMKENPLSEGGDPHTWVGNVLDQSLKGGLSQQGQDLVIKMKRLNETVSTLRQTLGLPATNSATNLTLQMLPGASTPNSGYARKQLNELENVVNQALNIKAIGGGGESKKSDPLGIR